jgi:prevent-host-death family protein
MRRLSLERVITATEARVRFGELMRGVVEGRGPVVVEKDGEPQVVILSLDEYSRLKAGTAERHGWLERVDRARERIATSLGERRLPPPDEILAELREERDAQLLGLR